MIDDRDLKNFYREQNKEVPDYGIYCIYFELKYHVNELIINLTNRCYNNLNTLQL